MRCQRRPSACEELCADKEFGEDPDLSPCGLGRWAGARRGRRDGQGLQPGLGKGSSCSWHFCGDLKKEEEEKGDEREKRKEEEGRRRGRERRSKRRRQRKGRRKRRSGRRRRKWTLLAEGAAHTWSPCEQG